MGSSFSVSSDRDNSEPITDRQRQFLNDLGERPIPRTKDEAMERLDAILKPLDSWLAHCFRTRDILPRDDERRLQIRMHESNFPKRFPKYGADLNDGQRLELQTFVKDVLGQDLFLAMSPMGIMKNAGALGVSEKVGKRHLPPIEAPKGKPPTIKGPAVSTPEFKKCPYCAEQVLYEAIKCKHCGETIGKPQKKKRTIRDISAYGSFSKSIGSSTSHTPAPTKGKGVGCAGWILIAVGIGFCLVVNYFIGLLLIAAGVIMIVIGLCVK